MGSLKGILPVLPTPFDKDGERIDYDSFQKLVDTAIADGADGLCLFAGGAEFYKLSEQEKCELFRLAVEVCDKRVPLIVTVSSHATILAQREALYAQENGASAINIMPPGFASPNGRMITEHVIDICKTVEIPAIIQYAPALTGVSISEEAFKRMNENTDRELYIKLEAMPTGPAITALREATGKRYDIIVGNGGECLYEALKRGACAVMPGVALIKPYHMIYDAFVKGDEEGAYRMFCDYLPHVHLMLRDIEQFVAMEKWILKKRAVLPYDTCRKPNHYPDAYTLELLEESVRHVADKFNLSLRKVR